MQNLTRILFRQLACSSIAFKCFEEGLKSHGYKPGTYLSNYFELQFEAISKINNLDDIEGEHEKEHVLITYSKAMEASKLGEALDELAGVICESDYLSKKEIRAYCLVMLNDVLLLETDDEEDDYV